MHLNNKQQSLYPYRAACLDHDTPVIENFQVYDTGLKISGVDAACND